MHIHNNRVFSCCGYKNIVMGHALLLPFRDYSPILGIITYLVFESARSVKGLFYELKQSGSHEDQNSQNRCEDDSLFAFTYDIVYKNPGKNKQ